MSSDAVLYVPLTIRLTMHRFQPRSSANILLCNCLMESSDYDKSAW
jgi:hypothetical protein